MEKNPLHFFRIQKTDRYVRLKFGEFNIYFSWHPLKTRQVKRDEHGSRKTKRKLMKRRLLESDPHCAICGKALTWEESSVHHIIPYSQDVSKEFDIDYLRLLCCDCHMRLHQIEALAAKKRIYG